MPLRNFMTATATTQRRSAPDATTGKTGGHSTYLQNVLITPVMLAGAKGEHYTVGVSNMDGVFTYAYEAYTESHVHDKDSVEVSELPDIRENDLVAIDSITYVVKRAAIDTATSAFGQTLYLYLDENNA